MSKRMWVGVILWFNTRWKGALVTRLPGTAILHAKSYRAICRLLSKAEKNGGSKVEDSVGCYDSKRGLIRIVGW